jgi:hypothetical protein
MNYIKVKSRFGHKKYARGREKPVKTIADSVDTSPAKPVGMRGNAPGIAKAKPVTAGPKITPTPSGAKLGNRH